MTDKKPEIERDEVMNNQAMLAKEYDISVDQVTGKVFIAGNLDGSEVILQGILLAYKKDKETTGVSFDHTKKFGNKQGTFSGLVYFENVPCDILANGTETSPDTVIKPLTEESTPKVIDAEYQEVKDESIAIAVVDIKTIDLPNLDEHKPKTLKAPDGMSRTERKKWWNDVRTKYPSCFDTTGNYIGYPKPPERPKKDWEQETEIALAEDLKKGQREAKFKPESVTGAGNEFLTMADQKVRSGYFMGKYFADKDAYSVISTPADSFDGSRIIFCNKQRTAEMFLEAAAKSPSFSKRLNGTEEVFAATVLKPGLFVDSNLAFYITNTVTALQGVVIAQRAEPIAIETK